MVMVCSGRGEGTLKLAKNDWRGDIESTCGTLNIDGRLIDGAMSVTNLENEAIARKQYLAGVVKENKTGRMCGASTRKFVYWDACTI